MINYFINFDKGRIIKYVHEYKSNIMDTFSPILLSKNRTRRRLFVAVEITTSIKILRLKK